MVAAGGKPVAGATVRVGGDGIIKTTSLEGLFRLDDLEARRCNLIPQVTQALSVSGAGFELQPSSFKYSGPPITVRLKPSAGKLVGTLKDADGKPAGGAVVRWMGDAVTAWVRADALGRFEIAGVPKRQGRIQALGRDGASAEAAVPAGEPKVALTLGRAAILEGRVTQIDSGKLVPSECPEWRTT